MKHIYSILLLLLTGMHLPAQTIDWVNYGGGSDYDIATGLAKDASGNFFMTGRVLGSGIFDIVPVSGGLFITKYSSNGSLLWITNEGNDHAYGQGVCLDNNGNVYVAGWMDSIVLFGNTLLTTFGQHDVVLAKFNSLGSLIWVKQFGGTGNDKAYDIKCDWHNNIYLTGYFSSEAQFGNFSAQAASDSTDIFIAKCDTAGNIQWVTTAGGIKDDDCSSIFVDTTGNIFITGSFRVSAYFGNDSVVSLGREDIFIARYDTAGNIVWVRSTGSVKDDNGVAICADHSGNCYVTGNFKDAISFCGNTFTTYTKDAIILSYSPSGNCRWSTRISGNYGTDATCISINEENRVFVGGFFHSYINLEGLSLSSVGDRDIFIARYDSIGFIESAYRSGGYDEDACFSILPVENNSIVIAGGFSASAWFGSFYLSSHGKSDAFIAKVSLPTLSIVSISDSVFCAGEQFDVVYQANGYFVPGNNFNIQITDSTGTIIYFTCGYLTSTVSGTVHGAIPSNFNVGSYYRLRLTSSNPLCVASRMNSPIALYQKPIVSISGLSSVCVNDSSLLVASGASTYQWVPANYLSSSTNDSVFAFPIVTTTFSVTGTNDYGCSNTASTTVTITLTAPNVTITAYGSTTVCQNQTVHLQTNNMSGVSYQWSLNGNAISGAIYSSYYAPQTGTYTCIATNACGATESNAIEVIVNPLPQVSMGSLLPVCVGTPAFALTSGFPAGGTYSGSYVSNGNFNPSTAGNWTVTYSYTDSNGCTATAYTIISVLALPNVSFSSPQTAFCETDAPFTLSGGNPSGGTYGGPGVSNGVFDPSAVGSGTFSITYTYTNINGCSKTVTVHFTVSAMPNVTLTMDTTICIYIPTFTLTGGVPSGGTYYVDGSSSTVFNPSDLGAGYHSVVYKKISGTCTAYDTVIVQVDLCTFIIESSFPESITLFPNPATDEVMLQISSSDLSKIAIYNEVGKCVKGVSPENFHDNDNLLIDVHSLPRGIYTLVVMSEAGKYFAKLVLQ